MRGYALNGLTLCHEGKLSITVLMRPVIQGVMLQIYSHTSDMPNMDKLCQGFLYQYSYYSSCMLSRCDATN